MTDVSDVSDVSDVRPRLFTSARTYSAYRTRALPDEVLRELYELCRWGPTSMNTQPMRVVFIRTEAGRKRLLPALKPGNVAKFESAPVTAIVASDSRFFEMESFTWHVPDAYQIFARDAALAQATAARNSSIQGGYFIVAARLLGLDCGPMSGFDTSAVDREFFPDGRWQANFLCNLGYGDPDSLKERNGRLSFEQACRLE